LGFGFGMGLGLGFIGIVNTCMVGCGKKKHLTRYAGEVLSFALSLSFIPYSGNRVTCRHACL
jgi:hypothetical protein